MSRPAITISVWAVIVFILFMVFFAIKPYLNIDDIPGAIVLSLVAIILMAVVGLIGFLWYGEAKRRKEAVESENKRLIIIEKQNEKLLASQSVQHEQGELMVKQHGKYVNEVESLHITMNKRFKQGLDVEGTISELSRKVDGFSDQLSKRDKAVDEQIQEVKEIAESGISRFDKWISDHIEQHKQMSK